MTKRNQNQTIKPDAKLAADAGVDRRVEVLRNIDTAEDLLGTALIEGLRMTVRYGATSKDEVAANYTRCNSPGVYASYFNRGFKAQQAVGEKLALKAIDDACALKAKGSMFVRACDALKAIVDATREAGAAKTGLKGAAATKVAKAAVVAAKAKAEAPKVVTKRGAAPVRDVTLQRAAADMGNSHRELATFLQLASAAAHKLSAPEGRENAHKQALAALEEACDAWGVFRK